MKLEFILNIIKAIIKVEGLSKAVIMLHGIFRSSGWTHLSIKITREAYISQIFALARSSGSHSVRLWVCDICEFITQSSCCLSPASDSCFSAVSQNSPSNLFGL